jgi:hypothetical protein
LRDSADDTRRPLAAPVKRVRNRQKDRRPIQRWLLWSVLVTQPCWIGAPPGTAQDVSKEQMQGLDEQVQEIKSDVLSIAAELGRLEEKLLYPSSTQVSVFVSLAEGESFRLDSVQILIDGAPVARHVYRFEELEALQKGGVQRIYVGNVNAGEHRLQVSMAGKLPSGKDVAATESFSFSKDVEPKLVGITLAGGESGTPPIRLGDR